MIARMNTEWPHDEGGTTRSELTAPNPARTVRRIEVDPEFLERQSLSRRATLNTK